MADREGVQECPPVMGDMNEMYIGEWKWGKKHGRGVQVWPDGSVYEGEWMQGKATGHGRLVNTNGEAYIGEWFDNRCHGYGRYFNRFPVGREEPNPAVTSHFGR